MIPAVAGRNFGPLGLMGLMRATVSQGVALGLANVWPSDKVRCRSNIMKPKLIKTRKEYKEALKRIEKLMDARPRTAQGDELELLTALVDIYERRHEPIPPPDPIDAIRFRMEQEGFKPKDLVPFIGSRNRVSEILSGRRRLTLRMIKNLHQGLGIPAESLLGGMEVMS
jgi:HTH-type transcriptional regulator/antitoxin HigA